MMAVIGSKDAETAHELHWTISGKLFFDVFFSMFGIVP